MSRSPAGSAEALGFDVGDPVLAERVARGLALVDDALGAAVTSPEYPFVEDTSRHLLHAGGKRFRPLLVLLTAQLGDPDAAGVVPAAVVVELTHLATLYHDDVMDEAPLRRGTASANARWDNTVAILTGDFLFARASDILADLGPEAVRLQARTFERLVRGQLLETTGPGPADDPVEHYLRVLADKTGSLIGTSCRFGARFAGVQDDAVEVLTRFGEAFGVAFQLSDDLLDVASDSGQSGKTPGTDLREGVHTLPVLLALRDGDRRLAELLAGDLSGDAELAEVLAYLRAHPAMTAARRVLAGYADEARSTLAGLPAGPVARALAELCDYVVDRTG